MQPAARYRDPDLFPRWSGILVALAVCSIFLPFGLVVVCGAVTLCSDALSYVLQRRGWGRVPGRATLILTVLSVLTSCGFMALTIALWALHQTMPAALSIAMIFGGLTNSVLIKSSARWEFYGSVAPQVLAAATLPVVSYALGAPPGEIAVTTLIVATLGSYFFKAHQINQKTRRALEGARERAEEANHAKDDFLALISHEIRTPLNGVLGMAQLMRSDVRDPALLAQIATVEHSALDVERIVSEILDTAKMETGQFDLDPQPVCLQSCCQSVVDLYAGLAHQRGLELTLDLAEGVAQCVRVDQLRLRQCLSNLVSNGLKYTEQGAVRVRVDRPKGDLLRVVVSDTGPGISDEDCDRIFERYQRAKSAKSGSVASTGLGLPITRQIARLMGGDVAVRSVLGQGSEFELTFEAPVVTEPALQQQVVQRGALVFAKAHPRILIVDDNRTNRTIAAAFVKKMGCQSDMAVDGVDALTKLKSGNFDLLLLDMNMPRMGGEELFGIMRRSKAAWGQIPVIAFTAEHKPQTRDHYMAIGINEYVSKPLHREDLEDKIVRLLSAPAGDRLSAGDARVAVSAEV